MHSYRRRKGEIMRAVPHPAEGSTVTIEPLRSLEDVARVKAVLTNPKDLALFVLGVNTNLRASDLLALRGEQIDWMAGTLTLRESKTGKKRTIPLGPRVMEVLYPLATDGLLFPSNKSGGPLTMSAWNGKMKLWCSRAGIKGNFGARTIRKTWAYLQFTVFGAPIEALSAELGHTSLRDTYRYIALPAPETARIFANFI